MTIYTIKEASQKLKIHYRTLLREISRGHLNAIKKGSMYFLTSNALQKYSGHSVTNRILKVAVILIVNGNRVVIVKRKYPELTLIWQFPSGMLRENIPLRTNIANIAQSETGLEVVYIKKIGTRISPETRTHLVYFLTKYKGGKLRNASPLENSKVKWVLKTDTLKYFTSSIYKRLLYYLK